MYNFLLIVLMEFSSLFFGVLFFMLNVDVLN